MENQFNEAALSAIVRATVQQVLANQAITHPQPTTSTEYKNEYLTVDEAAKFLKVARQTIYQNVKRLPHIKRFGKLYFKVSELVAYLEAGQKKGGAKWWVRPLPLAPPT